MYTTSQILHGPIGNNAFSYDQRINKSIYIPSIREGDFSDVRVGTQTVFEDMDENNILCSCRGLDYFIRTTWQDIPVIIFDNHNHALYFWYEALASGIISR